MATAGTINVFLNAITTKFDDGINSAHKKLRGLTKGFADINGAMMVAKAAFNAAATVVANFTEEIARLDEIGDAAERLNITAESLVKLRHAVKLTGGEIEGVSKSLTVLQRTLGDAAMGQSGPIKALNKLGLSAGALIHMDLPDAFKAIVDRISKLPTPAERASVATDLFGRSAENLGGLLAKGSDALREASNEIDRFGEKLDEARMNQVDAAQKSFDRLSLAWQGLKAEIALATTPGLAAGAEGAAGIMAGLRDPAQRSRTVDSFIPPNRSGNGVPWWQRYGFTSDPGARPPRIPPRFVTPREMPQSDSLDAYMRGWSLRPRHPLGPEAAAGGNPFSSLVGLRDLVGGRFGSDPRNIGMGGATPALEFGSQAAFSAVNQSRREDEMAKLQKQEIEETKKTNKILERGFENAIILSELDLQG